MDDAPKSAMDDAPKIAMDDAPKIAVETPREQVPRTPVQSVVPVSPVQPFVPEPIQLPQDDVWDIYITYGSSTKEIWGRLIGEDYSVSVYHDFIAGQTQQGIRLIIIIIIIIIITI
jgi:hypothetical protein